MAVDKSDSSANQNADAAKQTKQSKTKKTSVVRQSGMLKSVAEAKEYYKDLNLSEGRHLRKRPASSHPPAKKVPAKKASNSKKPVAEKKTVESKKAVGKKEKVVSKKDEVTDGIADKTD